MQPTFLNEGNENTINELAMSVTAQPAIFKTGVRKQGGFLGAIGLGRDLGEEAQKIVDDSTAELAMGKMPEAPDLGAIPTMGGVDRTDFGMMLDSKDEAQRQLKLAIAAEERGNKEAAKKHKDKMNKHINIYNLINNSGKGPLTTSTVKSSVTAFGNTIAETSGLKTETVLVDGNHRLKFEGQNVENQNRLNIASNTVTLVYENALKVMSPGEAYTAINTLIGDNQLPKLVSDGVGGYTIVSAGTLVPEGFIGGLDKFAPPLPPPTNGDSNNNNDLTLQEIEEQLKDPTLSMADRQTLEIEKEELLKQQNTGSGQMGRNN